MQTSRLSLDAVSKAGLSLWVKSRIIHILGTSDGKNGTIGAIGNKPEMKKEIKNTEA